jgi:hypothetical protein
MGDLGLGLGFDIYAICLRLMVLRFEENCGTSSERASFCTVWEFSVHSRGGLLFS